MNPTHSNPARGGGAVGELNARARRNPQLGSDGVGVPLGHSNVGCEAARYAARTTGYDIGNSTAVLSL